MMPDTVVISNLRRFCEEMSSICVYLSR